MGATIVFYLDFISPFAYLANCRLPQLARRHGAVIEHRPLDVMQAKLATGNFAPSTRSMPDKARFIRRDRLAWAAAYGVPMRDPKAFRAPRLNVGLLYAHDRGRSQAYCDEAWRRVWGEGGDPDDEGLLREVCRALGWDEEDWLRYVGSPEAAARWGAMQRQAWRDGVFGVPMLVLDGQMYWGNDRLDFLEEQLAGIARTQGETR